MLKSLSSVGQGIGVAVRHLVSGSFCLCAFSCLAADDSFYRNFLTIADTNISRAVLIESPLLIDTNNTAPKLANSVISLEKLRAEGKVGEVHLGMSMDEVVACWGKPKVFYCRCGGGPRFIFNDVTLVFQSNALMRIYLPDKAVFDCGPWDQSTLNDWIRVLGLPSGRTDHRYGSDLRYETPHAVLYLSFGLNEHSHFAPVIETRLRNY
jgi:hypothetical protein